MPVKIDRTCQKGDVGDAGLLGSFTQRRGGERAVPWLAVPSQLEPSAELAVEGKQDVLSRRVENGRAHRNVPGPAIPQQAV